MNPNLLFVGNDHGVYVSIDRGAHVVNMSLGETYHSLAIASIMYAVFQVAAVITPNGVNAFGIAVLVLAPSKINSMLAAAGLSNHRMSSSSLSTAAGMCFRFSRRSDCGVILLLASSQGGF